MVRKYYVMDFLDFDSDNEFIFSCGFLMLNILIKKICYVEFLKVVMLVNLVFLLDDFLFDLEYVLLVLGIYEVFRYFGCIIWFLLFWFEDFCGVIKVLN